MSGNTLVFFDFWGAGNMGDDLMMAGFAHALRESPALAPGPIQCLCNWDIASQRRRFPQFTWIESKNDASVMAALEQAEVVVGLGGTPFQLTSGDWLLRHMARNFARLKAGTKVVFINVGAETEIQPRADEFAEILLRIDRVSARDEFSRNILGNLGAKPTAEIVCGSDLANLSLPSLVKAPPIEKAFELGVILGFDTLSKEDLQAARAFLSSRVSKRRVAFITGDARDDVGFEYDLYRTWTRNWFSPMRHRLSLQRPNYPACSLEDLARPIAQCETLITSRFHGLLTGAWFGARVAAIGRSSKVTALADALNVPVIRPPLKVGDLAELEKNAIRVAPQSLEKLRQAALAGVTACLGNSIHSSES